jgi:hypothetical protein
MANQPFKKISFFGISAAVWENEGRRSVSFQKSYKDKEGAWQNTGFFGVQDLPNLAAVCLKLANEDMSERINPNSAPAQQKQAPRPKTEYKDPFDSAPEFNEPLPF